MSAEGNPDLATALLESAPIASNQNAPFCVPQLRTLEYPNPTISAGLRALSQTASVTQRSSR
jgi:hypothetical protein